MVEKPLSSLYISLHTWKSFYFTAEHFQASCHQYLTVFLTNEVSLHFRKGTKTAAASGFGAFLDSRQVVTASLSLFYVEKL